MQLKTCQKVGMAAILIVRFQPLKKGLNTHNWNGFLVHFHQVFSVLLCVVFRTTEVLNTYKSICIFGLNASYCLHVIAPMLASAML